MFKTSHSLSLVNCIIPPTSNEAHRGSLASEKQLRFSGGAEVACLVWVHICPNKAQYAGKLTLARLKQTKRFWCESPRRRWDSSKAQLPTNRESMKQKRTLPGAARGAPKIFKEHIDSSSRSQTNQNNI
ncbi:hypothetical protein ILYODFUR_017650 [Ilyodon furcidens]|uniref:Uncharacterized protein n=1 Tax=Ilyodon furcidens TaxID=33524 RepID=A0ABV0SQ18_9TELE